MEDQVMLDRITPAAQRDVSELKEDLNHDCQGQRSSGRASRQRFCPGRLTGRTDDHALIKRALSTPSAADALDLSGIF